MNDKTISDGLQLICDLINNSVKLAELTNKFEDNENVKRWIRESITDDLKRVTVVLQLIEDRVFEKQNQLNTAYNYILSIGHQKEFEYYKHKTRKQ